MTDSGVILEVANLITQLISEVRDQSDVIAELERRIEQIEKVMD